MTRHHLNILGLIINCTLITLFVDDYAMMWILMGLSAILFLFFLALGILLPNRNYFIKSKNRIPSKEVLLTFDDGPDPELTPKVLDILKKHHIKALFFVIGDKVDQHPEIVHRIIEEGHAIGNHTKSHNIFFATLSQDRVDKEIALCDNILIAHGFHPGNYFRPPVGYTNPRIARSVLKYKKRVIGWSLRSFDSVYKEEQKLLDRLNSKIKPGNIVLLHDNLPHSMAVLDSFLTTSKNNGIKFANPTVLNPTIK